MRLCGKGRSQEIPGGKTGVWKEDGGTLLGRSKARWRRQLPFPRDKGKSGDGREQAEARGWSDISPPQAQKGESRRGSTHPLFQPFTLQKGWDLKAMGLLSLWEPSLESEGEWRASILVCPFQGDIGTEQPDREQQGFPTLDTGNRRSQAGKLSFLPFLCLTPYSRSMEQPRRIWGELEGGLHPW